MITKLISVELIDPNPHQVRNEIDESDLFELIDSIKDVGIIQPLLVTPNSDRYTLVAGHRRLEAARHSDIDEVPCLVQDIDESVLVRYALIENLQRVDLDPLEEAVALKKLIDTERIDYRKAAELTGKSKTFVGERLALLKLPVDLKNAVAQGKISMKKADVLRRVKKDSKRLKLLEKAPTLDLPTIRALVEKAENRMEHFCNPDAISDESKQIVSELKNFAREHEGVRVYKDRVSFKYDGEETLCNILKEMLDYLEAEYESKV